MRQCTQYTTCDSARLGRCSKFDIAETNGGRMKEAMAALVKMQATRRALRL